MDFVYFAIVPPIVAFITKQQGELQIQPAFFIGIIRHDGAKILSTKNPRMAKGTG